MTAREAYGGTWESMMREANERAIRSLQDGPSSPACRKPPKPHICSSCSGIDFAKGLETAEAYSLSPDTVLSRKQALDVQCAICHLLYQHVFLFKVDDHGKSLQGDLVLSPSSFRGPFLDNQTTGLFHAIPRALFYPGNGSWDLRIHRDNMEDACRSYLAIARTSNIREYFADPTIPHGPRSHLRQPAYNPSLVRGWLHHAGIASPSTITPVAICGMRLIDCEQLLVVERQDDMAYIALSYVWKLANNDLVSLHSLGRATPELLSRAGSLPSHIPRVVANAITVTTDLGLRYLWVDQYCIDQQAGAEILCDHVSKMDQVYMSAHLTIIAASTCGALPGVMDTPRRPQELLSIPAKPRPDLAEDGGANDTDKDTSIDQGGLTLFTTGPHVYECVKKSVWYQRGWCFQESVLSPVRLYFTDFEAFLQTHDDAFTETYPEPHDSIDTLFSSSDRSLSVGKETWKKQIREQWTRDMYSLKDPRGQFWAGLGLFIHLLEVYTDKHLTQEMDSIKGFQGVLRFFTRMIPGFTVIAGVPLFIARPAAPPQNLMADTELNTTSETGSENLRRVQEQQRTSTENMPAEQSQSHARDSTERPSSNAVSATPDASAKENTNRFQQQCLTSMLLWRHDCWDKEESSVLRRRLDFPSWSWAGWRGKVSWSSVVLTKNIHKYKGENCDEDEDEDEEEDDSEEEEDDSEEEEDDSEEEEDDSEEDDNEDDDEDDDEDDEDDEKESEREDNTSDPAEDSENDNNRYSQMAYVSIPAQKPDTQHIPSHDWQIKALELQSGHIVQLSQDLTTTLTSQFDEVTHLIGEAYILPSSSIILKHTASNLGDVSRVHKVANIISWILFKAGRYHHRLKVFLGVSVRNALKKMPWLTSRFDILPRDPRLNALSMFPNHAILRRILYHASRYIWFSKLHSMISSKFLVDAAFVSNSELAWLPQESPLLEQTIRAKLDDGTWGLLVANARNCLVVQWRNDDNKLNEIEGADTTPDEGAGSADGNLRHCTRVGTMEFRHYLYSGPEVDMDAATIFSAAEKVQFRLA